ncbi:MAG: hypothetical protein JKY48_14055 [Flavobacteriales bacterium]|nr:hypothetical protein [Flavobacteriales bacterium]
MRLLLLFLSIFVLQVLSYGQIQAMPKLEKIGENKGLYLENEVSNVKVDVIIPILLI